MSQSILYGIGRGELKLRPGMRFAMNEKGQWTGSAEFTCVQGDFATSAIQTRLKPGTRITDLSASVPLSLSFLALDTFESSDDPGGWTIVSVTLKGFTENQWDFDNDRTKVYSRTTSLVEKSIFDHPKVKSELASGFMLEAMKLASDGHYKKRDDSTPTTTILVGTENPYNQPVFQATDANFAKWYEIIVVNGHKTYLVPQTEWTESTTGRLPLSASDMDGLGYIDASPPGNPAIPTGQNWMFTGVSENIQKQGDGSNGYSRTWTSSGPEKYNTEIYAKP